MNQTKRDRQVTRVFVDLFPTSFALFFQLFKRFVDRPHQLKNNRSGNVGHDAQAENRDIGQLATTENRDFLKKSSQIAAHVLGKLSHLLLIDNGERDLPANSVDCQQKQGQKNFLTQFRDSENDS